MLLLSLNRDFTFAPASNSVVGVELDADADGVQLVNTGDQLRIAIAPEDGPRAPAQLWRKAPAVLGSTGELKLGEGTNELAARSRSLVPFGSLPPSQGIRSRGEFNLEFPLIGAGGNAPSEAVLELAVAPDRSGTRPIATIYLNGQLLSAQRLTTGSNTLRLPLPPKHARLQPQRSRGDRQGVGGAVPTAIGLRGPDPRG